MFATSSRPDIRIDIAELWRPVLVVLAIATIFLLYSAGPVPDYNEMTYLVKARSFWDNNFCPNDIGLSGTPWHIGFYVIFGWLVLPIGFDWFAILGRIIAASWVALAWVKLTRVLGLHWLSVLVTAPLYLVLSHITRMSGEWTVGGFEGKPFAYGMVLIGLAALVRGRLIQAFVATSSAVPFHPVVGSWSCLCIWPILLTRGRVHDQTRLVRYLSGAALVALLVACLAYKGLSHEASAGSSGKLHPSLIRGAHHLRFTAFPTPAKLMFMLGVAGVATAQLFSDQRKRLGAIHAVFSLSVMAVAVGIILDGLIYISPLAQRLLQVYWFRFADALLPMILTFSVAIGFEKIVSRPKLYYIAMASVFVVLVCAIGYRAVHRSKNYVARVHSSWCFDLGHSREASTVWSAWKEACEWIRNNTDSRDVVLTPPNQTFKWFASRSECVNIKHVPEANEELLLEWQERVRELVTLDWRHHDNLGHWLLSKMKKYGARWCLVEGDCGNITVDGLRLRYFAQRNGKRYYCVYEIAD